MKEMDSCSQIKKNECDECMSYQAPLTEFSTDKFSCENCEKCERSGKRTHWKSFLNCKFKLKKNRKSKFLKKNLLTPYLILGKFSHKKKHSSIINFLSKKCKTPHNTTQYIIQNHNKQKNFDSENLIEDICIPGGTMIGIIKYLSNPLGSVKQIDLNTISSIYTLNDQNMNFFHTKEDSLDDKTTEVSTTEEYFFD